MLAIMFKYLVFYLLFEFGLSLNTDDYPYEDLMIQNEKVNLFNYNFTINPGHDICDLNADIFLLIYVHTSPSYLKRRLAIRETYSRRSMFRDIRIVFMMGLTNDSKSADLLRLEANTYADIVQADYYDSYYNLTYKAVSSMKWIAQYCNQTKFILKLDDDIIPNIFLIIKRLNSLLRHNQIRNKSLMCLFYDKHRMKVNSVGKWKVSKRIFSSDSYGQYCSGSAFILTNDLPQLLYNVSQYFKFFWVDDYFLTGPLARAVNVTYVKFNKMYIINPKYVLQSFEGSNKENMMFGHLRSYDMLPKMHSIWDSLVRDEILHFPSAVKGVDQVFSYLDEFVWINKMWYQANQIVITNYSSHLVTKKLKRN